MPRTGSTTVRSVLDRYSDIKSVHITQTTGQFPFYHHIPARKLKPIFDERGWDWFAYRRFCVVRNPFDRVVSLYHHYKKINADRGKSRTSLRNFLKYLYFQVRPEITFAEYVMNLNPQDPLTVSLAEFICDENGEFLVDDVLTFERLNSLLPAYLQQMGLFITEEDIPVLNTSTEREPYTLYYTHETRERVASLYAYEIQRFSYTFGGGPEREPNA